MEELAENDFWFDGAWDWLEENGFLSDDEPRSREGTYVSCGMETFRIPIKII